MLETKGLDRRTKVYRDIITKRDDLLDEVLDGDEFRYLPEPRCRVCTADEARKGLTNGLAVKNLVDTLLLYPKSLADIQRTIDPMMETWPNKYRITYKSVRTHLNKHLAWDKRALRKMVERYAEQEGISIIDAQGRMLLTQEAWLEATVQMGWDRLVRGDIEPGWFETQRAFERMAEIRKQAEGEYSTAHLLAQLDVVIAVIREEVPREFLPRILARLRGEAQKELAPVSSSADDLLDEILTEQSKLAREEAPDYE